MPVARPFTIFLPVCCISSCLFMYADNVGVGFLRIKIPCHRVAEIDNILPCHHIAEIDNIRKVCSGSAQCAAGMARRKNHPCWNLYERGGGNSPQLVNRGSTGLLLWVKVHAAAIDGVQERVAAVKRCVQRVRPWLLVEDVGVVVARHGFLQFLFPLAHVALGHLACMCVCVQVRARARSCVCRSAYSISVCKGDVHASACTHARVRAHTHRDTLTQPSTLGSRPSAATAAASGQGTLSEGHGFGTHSQPVNVCECLSTYRVCPSSEHARQTWPL